jgi:hypothetical protein
VGVAAAIHVAAVLVLVEPRPVLALAPPVAVWGCFPQVPQLARVRSLVFPDIVVLRVLADG